jgi:GTP-binding protein HflX
LIEVWNKIDQLTAETREGLSARARRAGAVAVSALTGAGIGALLARIAALVDDGPELVFRLSPADGEALAWLYRHGRVSSREDTPEVALVRARLDAQSLGRFQRMRPDAELSAAVE